MGQFVGGSGAGGAGGANPAGSGTELNARLNGTTFQAVTGSSISGANVTLTGTVTAAGFIGSGAGNYVQIPEGTIAGNAAAFGVISADSATHALYESDNNGTFYALSKTFVNSQVGTAYTTLGGDCNKLISQSNAAASAITLVPQPNGCKHFFENRGAGSSTITPALAAPPAPALSTSTSGGSLAATTSDCVVITFVNAGGETVKSAESCITTGAGPSNSITVTAPTLPTGVGAATGYTVYSGPTGAELKQSASNACVNITTNCVIQVLGAGASPPASNTAAAGTVDGSASLIVAQNQGLLLASDGSNWFTGSRGLGSVSGSAPVTVSATGNIALGSITSITGTDTSLPSSAGAFVNGNVVKGDANGGVTDSGTALSALALLASPTFTGTPAAPTAAALTNTTQVATTAFVYTAVNNTTWVLPVSAANSTGAFVTNATRLYGFTPVQTTSTTLQYNVQTADNTANLYDIGIYNTSGTLLAHLGATAGTTLFAATGARSAAWTGGSVTLASGKYWLGVTTNCAASCGALGGNSIFTMGSQAIPTGNNVTSGGALNSSITPPADAWSVAGVPAIALR